MLHLSEHVISCIPLVQGVTGAHASQPVDAVEREALRSTGDAVVVIGDELGLRHVRRGSGGSNLSASPLPRPRSETRRRSEVEVACRPSADGTSPLPPPPPRAQGLHAPEHRDADIAAIAAAYSVHRQRKADAFRHQGPRPVRIAGVRALRSTAHLAGVDASDIERERWSPDANHRDRRRSDSSALRARQRSRARSRSCTRSFDRRSRRSDDEAAASRERSSPDQRSASRRAFEEDARRTDSHGPAIDQGEGHSDGQDESLQGVQRPSQPYGSAKFKRGRKRRSAAPGGALSPRDQPISPRGPGSHHFSASAPRCAASAQPCAHPQLAAHTRGHVLETSAAAAAAAPALACVAACVG
jgi:hypothetical protein